jgi:D-alanyl-lipoteichoic acid acyltransferase DltB (MBOAT superfamily)
MAIGIARVFGFRLPRNFNAPYFSLNPRQFWSRWYISLSSWLRDYVFLALGGDLGGRLKACRNLMIAMLLGGLWYGASWNFVLWGFMHGVALIAHAAFARMRADRKESRGARAVLGRVSHCVSVLDVAYLDHISRTRL